jgi:hypothetical protein
LAVSMTILALFSAVASTLYEKEFSFSGLKLANWGAGHLCRRQLCRLRTVSLCDSENTRGETSAVRDQDAPPKMPSQG